MSEPRGITLWVPVSAGIVLWLVHLTALSALTPVSCAHGTNWVAHLITLVTGALTVAAMAACEAIRRRGARGDRADREMSANLVFLGWFGLVIGGFSLALIVYEGSWALWVGPCHP